MLKDFYEPFDESIERTMNEAERIPREWLEEETGESMRAVRQCYGH